MSKWVMTIPFVISTTKIDLTEEQKEKVLKAKKEGKPMVAIDEKTWITTDFISLQKVEGKIN